MTTKNLIEAVENLIKTNQTSEPTELSLPSIQSLDIFPLIQSYLSPAALKVLNTKANGMIHQYDVRLSDNQYFQKSWVIADLLGKMDFKYAKDFDRANYIRQAAKCYCFGFTSDENRVGEVAIKLTQAINNLASNNMILATLAPMLSIKMSTGKYCTVSYLAVDSQYEQLVQSTYSHCMFQEGAIPPELP